MRAFWIYVFGAQGWGGGSSRERVREFYIINLFFQHQMLPSGEKILKSSSIKFHKAPVNKNDCMISVCKEKDIQERASNAFGYSIGSHAPLLVQSSHLLFTQRA